jgi:nicotinate-nucleotide adenylyltransferase
MIDKKQPVPGIIISTGICGTCKGTRYQVKEDMPSSKMYSTGYTWICPHCDHICPSCGKLMTDRSYHEGTMYHTNYICLNQFCPGKIRTVGVLGGTFNPFHDGHLRFAESLRESENFDRILFVPAFDPPHKNGEEVVSFDQRVQMIEAAISNNPRFCVSRIEETLLGKSYSFNMIEALKKEYPKIKFVFLLGLDSWVTLTSWHQYEEILGLCDFIFACDTNKELSLYWAYGPKAVYKQLTKIELHQYQHKNGTKIKFILILTPKIRSTDIRELLKQKKSCRYLVPEPIYELINKWKLYTK